MVCGKCYHAPWDVRGCTQNSVSQKSMCHHRTKWRVHQLSVSCISIRWQCLLFSMHWKVH
eukprot:1159295-Pelagomonas_calceolata.AAC.6